MSINLAVTLIMLVAANLTDIWLTQADRNLNSCVLDETNSDFSVLVSTNRDIDPSVAPVRRVIPRVMEKLSAL